MAGLVLKLGPGERVLVNGAVIENSGKRSKFSVVSPGANILRLKDAISPDQAITPVSRVYYLTQLVLAGDLDPEDAFSQVERGINELSGVFKRIECQSSLGLASGALRCRNYYGVLKNLRHLLEFERVALGLDEL